MQPLIRLKKLGAVAALLVGGGLAQGQTIPAKFGVPIPANPADHGAMVNVRPAHANLAIVPTSGGTYAPSAGGCESGHCGNSSYFTFDKAHNADGCVWFGVDYLHWHLRGYSVPALATTAPAGTPRAVGGLLNDPNTTVIFGNQTLQSDWMSGVRLKGGFWMDRHHTYGIEASGFVLGQSQQNFSFNSDGNPGLFRPFIDAAGNGNAQMVAFLDPDLIPGLLSPVAIGIVDIQARTDFSGYEINYRHAMCGDCVNRVDGVFGFRNLRLHDRLRVRSGSQATAIVPGPNDPQFGTTVNVSDQFETTNNFYGFNLGFQGEQRTGAVSLGWHAKVGLGNTVRRTQVNGVTRTQAPNANPVFLNSGLLAQDFNSGSRSENDFSVVPDLGFSFGVQLTPFVRVNVGYNFLYWNDIARAGSVIDLRLPPPNLVPGVNNGVRDTKTDLIVHGLNVGLEVSY